MLKKVLIILSFAFVALLIFPSNSQSTRDYEVFYLRNGSYIEGLLIHYYDGVFDIQTPNGRKKLNLDEVIRIDLKKKSFPYVAHFPYIKENDGWQIWERIGNDCQGDYKVYVKYDPSENGWVRLHQNGYAVIEIYKNFLLPYNRDTYVKFKIEMKGYTYNPYDGSFSDRFSYAGIIFVFYDKDGRELYRKGYVWSSSEIPFQKWKWMKRLIATHYKDFELEFRVRDIVKGVPDVSSMKVIFKVYGNDCDNKSTADMWIRDLMIEFFIKP